MHHTVVAPGRDKPAETKWSWTGLPAILNMNSERPSCRTSITTHWFKTTKYITPSSPFLYLGVTLTMDLKWNHQHMRMDKNLKQKLDALKGSYASPRQTLNILRTAIIPSLAYAFAVTPCSYPGLDKCDAMMIGTVINSKHKL